MCPDVVTATGGPAMARIRELSNNKRLLKFAAFVLGAAGERRYPVYKSLDLMLIAPLVQFIWVLDFRNGLDTPPRILFSGTHCDAHFHMNIVGKTLEDIYVEDDFDRVIRRNFYQVYEQGKIAYTRRSVHYKDDRVERHRTAEAIMLPCSSNGTDVDFGIAFTEYSSHRDAPDTKFFALI